MINFLINFLGCITGYIIIVYIFEHILNKNEHFQSIIKNNKFAISCLIILINVVLCSFLICHVPLIWLVFQFFGGLIIVKDIVYK